MKYKMYNCKAIKLIPPINFLKCNCGNEYKNEIIVDECLAEEIQYLWSQGIKTTGCCCGHGCDLGFIQVDSDSIKKMKELGYQHYLYIDKINDGTRLDAFIPKTTEHKTTEMVDYKFCVENRIK